MEVNRNFHQLFTAGTDLGIREPFKFQGKVATEDLMMGASTRDELSAYSKTSNLARATSDMVDISKKADNGPEDLDPRPGFVTLQDGTKTTKYSTFEWEGQNYQTVDVTDSSNGLDFSAGYTGDRNNSMKSFSVSARDNSGSVQATMNTVETPDGFLLMNIDYNQKPE